MTHAPNHAACEFSVPSGLQVVKWGGPANDNIVFSSAETVNLYFWPTNRPYTYPSTYVDEKLGYTLYVILLPRSSQLTIC